MARLTNFPNGIKTFVVGQDAEVKTANFTIAANTDSGKVFAFEGPSVVATLPALSGAAGNVYTFVNLAADGKGSVSISPNSADGINYKGSATDDKDLVLTLSNSRYGDSVTIASMSDAAAWQVISVVGNWTKQA